MKTKTLNIPNTIENHGKIMETAAEHIVENCLNDNQIHMLAKMALRDSYRDRNFEISDLVDLVKETPIKENRANCYPEQALLFMGKGEEMFFYVQSEDIQQNKVIAGVK